jgi:hypothetical protein
MLVLPCKGVEELNGSAVSARERLVAERFYMTRFAAVRFSRSICSTRAGAPHTRCARMQEWAASTGDETLSRDFHRAHPVFRELIQSMPDRTWGLPPPRLYLFFHPNGVMACRARRAGARTAACHQHLAGWPLSPCRGARGTAEERRGEGGTPALAWRSQSSNLTPRAVQAPLSLTVRQMIRIAARLLGAGQRYCQRHLLHGDRVLEDGLRSLEYYEVHGGHCLTLAPKPAP